MRELRDWWMHPPDPGKLGWVTWFERDIARLLPDGGAEYLIDIDVSQSAAEGLYAKLKALLSADES